jgi:hypothetical protein
MITANNLLWVVQVILGIKMLSNVLTHGVLQNQTKMSEGIARMGARARPALAISVFLSLLSGLAILLPAVPGFPGWLAPAAALFLAAVILLAAVFHRQCREKPNLIPGIVLFLLAACVALGRLFLAP